MKLIAEQSSLRKKSIFLTLLFTLIVVGQLFTQNEFNYNFLNTRDFLALTNSNTAQAKAILTKRPLKQIIKQNIGKTKRTQFILHKGEIQDLTKTEYFYVYENQKVVIYRTPIKSNSERYLSQFKESGFKYFGKSSLDNAIIYETSKYTLTYNRVQESGIVLFEILITDDSSWR